MGDGEDAVSFVAEGEDDDEEEEGDEEEEEEEDALLGVEENGDEIIDADDNDACTIDASGVLTVSLKAFCAWLLSL